MLPIYIESSILKLEKIYINGGKQGFLVSMSPIYIKTILGAEEVNVGISK
jgi:prolyl-tRNA editing enzyme YbaK/EbsC (Cys-tRNA(Pro) deacylase)